MQARRLVVRARVQYRMPEVGLSKPWRGSQVLVPSMIAAYRRLEFFTFPSRLGWMAAITRDGRLCELVFGGKTPQEAVCRLDETLISSATLARRSPGWVKLLKQYAAGERVNFVDVPLVLPPSLTAFQRRVLDL